MAHFFFQASDYNVGDQPDVFAVFGTVDSWDIRLDGSGNKYLGFSRAVDNVNCGLQYLPPGSPADVEMYIDWEAATDTTLALRNQGTASNQTRYGSTLGPVPDGVHRIDKMINESYSQLVNQAGVRDWARAKQRFRVGGTSLKSVVWEYTAPEPTTWGLQTTDTGITGGGIVSVNRYIGSEVRIYSLGVGTDGARAPTSQDEVVKMKKPSSITGLNVNHALYSDIALALELGQLNKELVTDTILTLAGNTTQTDAELGDCIEFSGAVPGVLPSFSVTTGDLTIMTVTRIVSGYHQGGSGKLSWLYANQSGDVYDLRWDSYSRDYMVGQAVKYQFDEFNTGTLDEDMGYAAHSVAAKYVSNGINKISIDGTIDDNTGVDTLFGAYNTSTIALKPMYEIGSSITVRVGAILVFGRPLTDVELDNVTRDPWALFDTPSSGPVTPVNPGFTNLLATSVRLTWEQG